MLNIVLGMAMLVVFFEGALLLGDIIHSIFKKRESKKGD